MVSYSLLTHLCRVYSDAQTMTSVPWIAVLRYNKTRLAGLHSPLATKMQAGYLVACQKVPGTCFQATEPESESEGFARILVPMMKTWPIT